MPKLNIVRIPDERLFKRSVQVDLPISKDLLDLLPEMERIMLELDGIGLAAPQVGINKRIIIVNTKNGVLPLFNPEILSTSKKTFIAEEGCLSVPGQKGLVKRYYKIKVKAFTFNGEKLEFPAEGLFSRVIQHEIDHLDGILFTSKIEK